MAAFISFRLRHKEANLRGMASAIEFPVAREWSVGEPRMTLQGDPLEGFYPDSYVVFKVITSEGSISAAIASLDVVLREAVRLQPILLAPELEKNLYCTIMTEGEEVGCDSLRKLVEWGGRLEISGCPVT